jgi:hypothetical protein
MDYKQRAGYFALDALDFVFDKVVPPIMIVVGAVSCTAPFVASFLDSQHKHVESPSSPPLNQTVVLKDCPSSEACVEKEVTITEEQLAEIMSSARKISITIEKSR